MARPFVDRIEGKRAVLVVDGLERSVPLDSLPAGVREGVHLTDDLSAIDRGASDEAAEEIAQRRARLVEDDGDDFSL